MSEPFIGEIRSFGFNFAPRGWAECNGQLIAISQNEALFSLLGTTYGGDGRTTFGLPDLRGRSSLHQGDGPGLSNMRIGQKSGQEQTTLREYNLPSHSHIATLQAKAGVDADSRGPKNKMLGRTAATNMYTDPALAGAKTQPMSTESIAVANTGGGQAFDNRDPYLVVNICIAMQGLYPPRD